MPTQRFKQTKNDRRKAEQKAERRKNFRRKPIKITQQPKKKRGAYHGRVTFEWMSGPDRGKKYSQPVTLPEPFKIKLRGQDIIIQPKDGDEYTWGEADQRQGEHIANKGKKGRPVNKEQGKRVKRAKDLIKEKLEALIEETGPREAGKTLARGFIIAHNKLKKKEAKRALAKLYGAVLKEGNRAAFLSFGAHVRRSASMHKGKKTEASAGKKLSAHALKKLIARYGEFDDNTLEQMVALSISEMYGGDGGDRLLRNLIEGDVELPRSVKVAASEYEEAARDLLTELGGDAAANEGMDRDAPYLMFMSQMGKGSLNDLKGIQGLDFNGLQGALNRHTRLGSAFVQLRNGIEEAALENAEDALTALVDAANEAVEEELTDRYDQYMEPYMGDEYLDGLGDQIAYSYGSLQKFAEDNRDRRQEELAEVIGEAFEAGRDERDIFEAIRDVGEVEWVRGYGATRGFTLTTPQQEVELRVSVKDTELLNNPYGDEDVNLQTLAEYLEAHEDIDAGKFDWKVDKHGDVTDYRTLDGYWNLDVDPRRLRRELRL